MSLRDGGKHLLLRVVPLLVLSWVVMSLSQNKALTAEITWAQLFTVVSLGLVYLALCRALIVFWRMVFGRDHKPPGLDPILRSALNPDQLNEMAVDVLSHELAHAVVSHRLGLKVRSVWYSPGSGHCHSDERRHKDEAVYWAGMATACAAGLLAPPGPPDTSTQHGNVGLEDDALALWRKATYAAAADGQSITDHVDNALQRARELMPDMAQIRREAERLMVPPAGGWRPDSPTEAVPTEDLQAFLRSYDPSTA